MPKNATPKPRKMRAGDAYAAERALVPTCVRFNSYYFGGRGHKEGNDFGTLAEAAADARAIEARNKAPDNPRGAMVYGQTPDGRRVFVDRDLWPAEG